VALMNVVTIERAYAADVLLESNLVEFEAGDSAGYRGSAAEMAASFLLDFALASNRDGVVLLSMYEEKHLRSNLERLTAAPAPDAVLGLQDQLARLR
jgi:hypothetical protein